MTNILCKQLKSQYEIELTQWKNKQTPEELVKIKEMMEKVDSARNATKGMVQSKLTKIPDKKTVKTKKK